MIYSPTVAPWRFFFPAAAAFALLAVPLWLLARAGAWDLPSAIPGPTLHASEMVFGYALAVIAGYLLPASSARHLAWLAAAWLAARLLWPFAAHLPIWLPPVAASVFPLTLAALAVARFHGAKRPRNRIFAAVFSVLAAMALLAYGAIALEHTAAAATATRTALYLVVLLITVMGGRLIPTATVGALRETGRVVAIRAQPGQESACIILTLAFVVLDASPLPAAWPGAAALMLGSVLLARMKDWRSIETWRLPEIWPLHLGYGWLALGFLMLGLSRTGIVVAPVEALHALAVGGIGTITLAMLARMTRLRTAARTTPPVLATGMHVLLASATLLRVFGGWAAPWATEAMLWVAGVLWSLAFAIFLWLFAHHVRRRSMTTVRGEGSP